MVNNIPTSEKIKKYVDAIFKENEKLDLTAADRKDFLRYHVADALAIAELISTKPGHMVVDIGSGQGIPGVVVAIELPKVNVTLIESAKKKAEFLSHVVELLDLKNVEVINARVEDFCRNEGKAHFDIALARGVGKLSILVEYALPLLKIGGIFLPQKGRTVNEELIKAKRALEILGGDVEMLKWYRISNRLLCIPVIRKMKETPSRYPRRPGIPSKRPIE